MHLEVHLQLADLLVGALAEGTGKGPNRRRRRRLLWGAGAVVAAPVILQADVAREGRLALVALQRVVQPVHRHPVLLQGGPGGEGLRTVAALMSGEERLGGGVAQQEVPLQVLLLAEGACAHRTAVLPQANVHAAHVLLQLAGRLKDQRAHGAGVGQPARSHHRLLNVADRWRWYCLVVVVVVVGGAG